MKLPVSVLRGALAVMVAIGTCAVSADELPGTGSLSGRVTAAQPFKAAKVYARNTSRHMTHMTYTSEGAYTFINLMPGTYAVTIETAGLGSDTQEVIIESGIRAVADFRLRTVTTERTAAGSRAGAGPLSASYDEIYPPGPGREIVEGTCIACHGVNWIPGRPNNDEGWNAMLDLMLNMTDAGPWGIKGGSPLIPKGTINEQQRAEVLAYLVRHFGPDKPVRTVRLEEPILLDEAALGKALWVEYSVAEPEAANGRNRWIQEPYFDLQGNVWLTERTNGMAAILKLDPHTGSFISYPTTDRRWSPHGIVVDPTDGQVWWAGQGVYLSRLDPKTGTSKDYTFSSDGHFGGHTPVFDSKGDIWFSMLPDDRIGHWDRRTDSIRTWKNPTAGGRPYGILVDHNDKIWYAQFYTCKITRFDPTTEKFTEFTAPSAPCTIRRLGLDSKGNIWYGAFSAGKLGVLNPATGKFKEYSINRLAEPYDTWVDPQNNVWIGDGGRGGLLIKFDQKAERFTNYPSPLPSDMPKLAITRDGAVWYSNRSAASRGGFPATVGVLYPDRSRMKTLGAHYALSNGKPVGSGSPRPASR
jgi:virginiamycin B lyase